MLNLRIGARRTILAVCTAALLVFAQAPSAFGYYLFGTVEVSPGAAQLSVPVGGTVTTSVTVTPASDDQTLGCGMAKCPQSCTTPEAYEAGYSCFDANGNCTCAGSGYSTYYAEVEASSSNGAIASAAVSGNTVVVSGNSPGEATITLTATLRQWRSNTATIRVRVEESGGAQSASRSSDGDVAIPEAAVTGDSRSDLLNEKVIRTVAGDVYSVEINSYLDTADYLGIIADTDDQAIFWSGVSSEMPEYSWTFDGESIAGDSPYLSFDPHVNVSDLGEGSVANIMRQAQGGVVLDFAHEGWLPGPASVYVEVGGTYADGTKLDLYRYDAGSARFELAQENLSVAAGYTSFPIDGCSTLALSDDDLSVLTVQEVNTPRADAAAAIGSGGDGSVVAIAGLIVAIGVALLLIVLLRRFLVPGKVRLVAIGFVVVVAAIAVVTLCVPRAFAMEPMAMGTGSATESASPSTAERSNVASGPYATDRVEEKLGLMPRLYRLTGSTHLPDGDGAVPVETVGALFPNILAFDTTPSSVSVGVECRNEEMCSVDPCNCGKPDAWGHCACGGFVEVVPAIDVSVSDPDVVRMAEAFGTTWLVPVSAGTARVLVSAELDHHEGAEYAFDVEVRPFGAVDLLLLVALAVVAIGVLVGACFLGRLAVRFVGGRWAAHLRWKARATELKAEHPLIWRAALRSERREARGRGRMRALRAVPRHADPFLHDMAFCSRRTLPLLLAGLALFVAAVPLSTSVIDEISVFNIDYTHEQIKYQLYAPDLGVLVNLACVVYGATLAVALFRFLLEKRSTTAFLSVGLSRTKLALSRFIVGCACVVIGIGAPFAISLVINSAALGLYDGQIADFAYVVCGYVTVALVSFALAALAVMHSGTLFEAAAFAVALLACVRVLLWGIGVLAEHLLVGNAAGALLYGQDVAVAPSFSEQLSWLDPASFFAGEGAAHQSFMALHPVYYPEAGDWPLVAGWFVVFLILSAIAVLAFCRRRGEQAEMAGMAPAFSLFSVAVFGLALFAAIVALLGALDMAVALVVGAALFVLLSLSLLFGPFRGRTTRARSFACVGTELAVMAAVVIVIGTGGLGYASYIPPSDQVESVKVSYDGSPSFLTESFAGVSGGASYYFTSEKEYVDGSSIDILRAVHAGLIGSARSPRETVYADFQATVVPYDVVLRYRMKDGSEVVRYYSQASIGELSALLPLQNDSLAKEMVSAAITGDVSELSAEQREDLSASAAYNAYRAGRIYAADGTLNRIMEVEVSDEERAALLDAVAADLTVLSAQDVYAPDAATETVLMFTLAPELDVASFGYSFSNAVLYVDDSWGATTAWLDRNGIGDALGSPDASVIESLTLQLDDPYASVNKVIAPVGRYFMSYRSDVAGRFWVTQDYGALKTIDDRARIAEILPSLRMGCYMTGGYLVQAKLSGIEAYVHFYLPAENAPSFL